MFPLFRRHLTATLPLLPLTNLTCCMAQLNMDLFEMTLGAVERAMKDAELEVSEFDRVVLVGGSTRIPKVQS